MEYFNSSIPCGLLDMQKEDADIMQKSLSKNFVVLNLYQRYQYELMRYFTSKYAYAHIYLLDLSTGKA